MKKILMVLSCTFLLFGCSANTDTESKDEQTVAVVGVTSINTIIYTADENKEQLKEIEKGFDSKKVEAEQTSTPETNLTLSFIRADGKKTEYKVSYGQNTASTVDGKTYTVDSKTIQTLQEQFVN